MLCEVVERVVPYGASVTRVWYDCLESAPDNVMGSGAVNQAKEHKTA